MRHRLSRILEAILHLKDTPHRVSLAFALGVWAAFLPLGFHTVLSLAIGFAFKLSRAALLMGNWVCNPWTIAPMYIAGTTLGCLLLGIPLSALADVSFDFTTVAAQRQVLASASLLVWPFLLGNLILGAPAGAVAYALLRPVLERRARAKAAARAVTDPTPEPART